MTMARWRCSGDDFYQMSPSQLVMLETTIGNSNATVSNWRC